ncbi:ParB family chromosome partitioning protein [Desulfobotulus alkaliphilus]|uniref:ParB family chromosome partitioning protein n=1 Tax=Desulfobotulus alkaliphilus TaxID=622671 RepID=A0A562RVR5_9BACT|nr:ParB/RepB/Spo0J family partition protein [Desulfobotulus alkaliphilus]TWI73189.1 ParB family chromosome partitioning protein [Desulfobotulus alkaliphilus]
MTDSSPSGKNRKKTGLGRGLSSLIPDIEAADREVSHNPETLSIHSLTPNPFQPRHNFDADALQELADSIGREGILQPVLVRRSGQDYQIVAGERRVRAAKMAGLSSVPVIIRDLDDLRMLQISIVENIQRNDLSPMEEARAYQRLVQEFSMTQEAVASSVGKSRSSITNFIRLLQLPAMVQDAMDTGKISMGHGRALLALEDEDLLLQTFREVVEKTLSVRECEALVKKRLSPGDKTTTSPSHVPEEYQIRAERLSSSLGTAIRIRGTRNAGKMEIPYTSPEEFDAIVKKLENL